MKLIPGRLYFVKDIVNDKKQLRMHVFGYQYKQLSDYLKNNNTFMFIATYKPTRPDGVEIGYIHNVYKDNVHYVFLGGSNTYTFVLNPERSLAVLEYFQE